MRTRVVIMAGGSGTRFYPLSREHLPKQFLPLFSEQPMILETLERILPIVPVEDVLVSANRTFADLVAKTLPGINPAQFLLEPCGRNTAPALGLACLRALQDDPDAVIISLHSDHLIRKESRFLRSLQTAVEIALSDQIVTLGITPTHAETGYGYIEVSDEAVFCEAGMSAYRASRFKEKPDFLTAQEYVNSGRYFWNAGMFIFKASLMLKQMQDLAPELYLGLMNLRPFLKDTNSSAFQKAFSDLPSVSIDVAILEKSDRVVVIPSDIGWSDVGSYLSLYELSAKNPDGNVCLGDPDRLLSRSSRQNLVIQQNPGKVVGLLGVKGLMVVDTPDYLLVGDLDESQDVKFLIPKTDKNS